MSSAFATGTWVEPRRIRAIALMSLVTTVVMIGYLFATAHGTVDYLGRPLGTDFSNVWTAGRMALDGRASLAWDWPSHFAVQQATHDRADIPFYGWHYPPPFLLIAASLSTMPYVIALIVWQASTFALMLATVRSILPARDILLVAAGAPVAFICLSHGHNGFLTAALLCGGLALLDRRPFVAGLLLGAMIYKPQFGLVLPVVLLIGGHWRAIGGAFTSAALLIAVTLALWGWPVWEAFLHSLPLTQSVVIEQGATGWEKIQSVFSAVRNWEGSVPLAWAVQSAMTGAAIVVAGLMVRGVALPVRNAVVVAAALLSTPYLLDYDLVPLSVAIAFLVVDGQQRGFLRYEKTLLVFVWATPLFGRTVMEHSGVPLGLISILVVLVLSVRRASTFDRCFARGARMSRSFITAFR
ncbi:MAG: glycosyltransferase family 87 protein [Sphingomonadales bacterium]